MKQQVFSGGLAVRQRPQFIQADQGEVFRNIDIAKSTLCSLPDKVKTALSLSQFTFYFQEEDRWLGYDNPTSFVEYQGTVYAVDGATPKRIKGAVTAGIGIQPPSTGDFTGSVVPGSGDLDGTYSYVLTFYDSTAGIESGPSPVSEDFVVTSPGRVDFAALPVSADPTADKKRLYRIGGTLTAFTLVTELPNATVAYSDTQSDVAIVGEILTTQSDLPAPSTLTHLAQYNGMLFGANGYELNFTPVGAPTAWPAAFGIRYPSRVVGSAATPNGLVVLTVDKTYLITGTDPSNLRSRTLDERLGCVSMESIQEFGPTAVWVSRAGICASGGGQVEILSLDLLGEREYSPVSSAVTNRRYFFTDASGITVCMDARFKLCFYELEFNVRTLASAGLDLYGWSPDGFYKLMADPNELMPFSYKSPRFVEGASSNLKSYKKIYIYAKGDIIINVYINDSLVLTKVLVGEKSHEFQVPAEKQRGYFIQFELSGKGEVYELEYVAGGRDEQ